MAIIRHESEPRQWRHVRSEHNPADYASRGTKTSETKKLEEWRNGAEFLWKNEDEWPPQATEASEASEALLDSDEGVEREKIMVGAAVAQKDFWSSLFQRCSKWDRLQRLVAWLVRVFHSFISVRSDWTREENCKVCIESFPTDIDKSVKTGRLARLKPFEEGILRVWGRLKHSNLQ